MNITACFVPLPADNKVGVVHRNVTGYMTTTLWDTEWNPERLNRYVDLLNFRIGVPKADAEAMHSCSMFDCWQNYDNIRATYEKALNKKQVETPNLCPRCLQNILKEPLVSNSLSRADNNTYICNACGVEEALLDAGLELLGDIIAEK